jgi:ABC-2 type transport system permease protein
MITDIWTVMRKELIEIFFQRANIGGSRRGGWFSLLLVVAVFGLFLPLQIGPDWLRQPQLLVFWAWVPLFLVTSVTTDTFAGERERHTLETLLASRLSDRAILLGKVAAAVAYGWGLSLVSVLLSVLMINLAYGQGQFLFYPLDVAALGCVLSFLAAGLSATAGVLISLRAASARQAAQIMSATIMVLLFIPLLAVQALPAGVQSQLAANLAAARFDQVAIWAAVVLAILDGLLLLAGLARFQRARLILD